MSGQTLKDAGEPGKKTDPSQPKNAQYTRGINIHQASITGTLHNHTDRQGTACNSGTSNVQVWISVHSYGLIVIAF